MGYSRDTFYRYKSAVDEGGVEALLGRTRKKPNLGNRVDEATEAAVIQSATDYPAYGQARTSNELRKAGIFVLPSGVRLIWLRHDLANFKKRLKALEVKVAEDGIILTEAQVQALEKKKLDDEAHGEIETACPSFLARLSGIAGYVLRWHHQGRGPGLSGELYRHLIQGGAAI